VRKYEVRKYGITTRSDGAGRARSMRIPILFPNVLPFPSLATYRTRLPFPDGGTITRRTRSKTMRTRRNCSSPRPHSLTSASSA
jgi:hypothetical protein